MFVELHILQNFSPSNLNRDDTNAPKDCEFGGIRRARISSQCIKRSIRTCLGSSGGIDSALLSRRTKRVADHVCDRMELEDEDRMAMKRFLAHSSLPIERDGTSKYLLFLANSEVDEICRLIEPYWEQIRVAFLESEKPDDDAIKEVSKELGNRFKAALNGGRAADLALFGRMIADLPNKNVDAASQVAHAISTHKVDMEFDYYTAVDDLATTEEPGAGMIGTVEFNSSCFYRYANIAVEQLKKNLDGDQELTNTALRAFLHSSVVAIPTGKQNSTAAQNPPSFVMAVVRKTGLWSLANAFAKPVYVRANGDLVGESILRLDQYWQRLEDTYGDAALRGKHCLLMHSEDVELSHLENVRIEQSNGRSAFATFLDRVMEDVKNAEDS